MFWGRRCVGKAYKAWAWATDLASLVHRLSATSFFTSSSPFPLSLRFRYDRWGASLLCGLFVLTVPFRFGCVVTPRICRSCPSCCCRWWRGYWSIIDPPYRPSRPWRRRFRRSWPRRRCVSPYRRPESTTFAFTHIYAYMPQGHSPLAPKLPSGTSPPAPSSQGSKVPRWEARFPPL